MLPTGLYEEEYLESKNFRISVLKVEMEGDFLISTSIVSHDLVPGYLTDFIQ